MITFLLILFFTGWIPKNTAQSNAPTKCEELEKKQRSLEKTIASLLEKSMTLEQRLQKAEKYVNTIKEKIQAKDDGIVVVGDITQALKAQQSGERKTSLFIQRAVFSFVGEPTTSMIQGDEHKPYYYHIRTPLREKDGRMYRYDLNCYAYGEARAFSALYVGYLFAGWNKQAGAPIVNAYSTYSGSKSPQKKFKTSQYIGRDRHLYLKFGPINRYVLQCVLHSQGLTGGERGKYSAFTRKDNGNDTPYPEQ